MVIIMNSKLVPIQTFQRFRNESGIKHGHLQLAHWSGVVSRPRLTGAPSSKGCLATTIAFSITYTWSDLYSYYTPKLKLERNRERVTPMNPPSQSS